MFLLSKYRTALAYIEKEFIKPFHAPHRNILENQRVKLGSCADRIIFKSHDRTAPAERAPGPNAEVQLFPPGQESRTSPGTS